MADLASVDISRSGVGRIWHPQWVHLFGAFGPMLSAFIVTGITLGSAGLRQLIHRMFDPSAGWKWIAFALLMTPALFVLGMVILRIINGEWANWAQFGYLSELPEISWVGVWFVQIATFGFGEETGWRGFALPRLQRKHTAGGATIRLAAIWLLWHLPLFTYNYPDMDWFNFIGYVIGLFFGAVFLTWMFNASAGSLLAVSLWHGTFDATVAGAEPLVAALVTAAIILTGIIVSRKYGPENFAPRQRQQI